LQQIKNLEGMLADLALTRDDIKVYETHLEQKRFLGDDTT